MPETTTTTVVQDSEGYYRVRVPKSLGMRWISPEPKWNGRLIRGDLSRSRGWTTMTDVVRVIRQSQGAEDSISLQQQRENTRELASNSARSHCTPST